MIDTKHLIRFVENIPLWVEHSYFEKEYLDEIVARLERYDEMKEGIEKLCRDLSSRVDR